ncbi:MAG: glutamyl-tRNA reductase [Actinomycetota bacterium]
MSFVLIGLSHRSAPLDVLERCSIAPDDRPKLLSAITSCHNVSEAVVVSSCHRSEVYVNAETFHGAYSELFRVLGDLSGLPPERLTDHLVVAHDDDAVRHLFSVAAGLDSAVLGEHEILGQVRTSWDTARTEGASGSLTNLVFRHALTAGKRARTETDIARGTASISSAAVDMAADHLGGLDGRSVLVLGAGEMGEGMVVALADAGVSGILIANRTAERGEALAHRVGGRAISLSELGDALPAVDVLLTSTGATSMLLEHAELEPAVRRRDGRPLLVVDIAVPRDVDPAVGELPGVTLLDMDDLHRFAETGRRGREAEVGRVREIVEDEVANLAAVRSAQEVAPLITEVRGRAEAVRVAELARFERRLAELGDAERDAVEALTRGLIAKLLHEPTVRLKEAAGSPKGARLADAMRDLYGL